MLAEPASFFLQNLCVLSVLGGKTAAHLNGCDLFCVGAAQPPFHPSLRIRKMQGRPDIWEGHITLQYVFTFHLETEPTTGELIYVFRAIGTHNIYRNP